MSASGDAATRSAAFLSMTSPLAPNTLIPVALEAEEAIDAPFLITLDMVSDQDDIAPDSLLHLPVCVKLQQSEQPVRYFHGLVRDFAATGAAPRGQWAYRAEIVPRFWFLRQGEDSRVYQNMTAVDILQKIFAAGGVTDTSFNITGTQTSREYTVQYNESYFDFASRLMQEEGYFYFFSHSDSTHQMIIADANTAFTALADPRVSVGTAGIGGPGGLTRWQSGARTAEGAITLDDYDPTAPATALADTQNTTAKAAGASQRAVYHWPAHALTKSAVTAQARLCMEAIEAAAVLGTGAGANAAFCAGSTFTLSSDPYGGKKNQSYVITRLRHRASDGTAQSGGGGTSYANDFTCLLASVPWRPARVTPRPRMAGLFSATVLGPSGEEIYTDEYGRVKVLLRWDHTPDATADGALWVRVVQSWAGNGWGWQFLPRVGTEVAVAFLDADPDRPVVIGGLYNGAMSPPFALPDQKTKSGLRTRSSTGGGTADYSEISFDDKAGSEIVLLHAQKDLTVEVEHDQTLTVDNCRVVTIKKDESVTIKGKQTIDVTGNRSVQIDQGNDSLAVQQGNLSIDVALGNVSIKADAGKIAMQAMQSIELTVGSTSLKLTPEGITLSALMIKIGAEAMLDMKAPMTTLKGEGMLTLKGGIMMLN